MLRRWKLLRSLAPWRIALTQVCDGCRTRRCLVERPPEVRSLAHQKDSDWKPAMDRPPQFIGRRVPSAELPEPLDFEDAEEDLDTHSELGSPRSEPNSPSPIKRRLTLTSRDLSRAYTKHDLMSLASETLEAIAHFEVVAHFHIRARESHIVPIHANSSLCTKLAPPPFPLEKIGPGHNAPLVCVCFTPRSGGHGCSALLAH